MKHSNIFKYVAGVAVLGFMTSCNDFLDQEPMSSVSPEKYLKYIPEKEKSTEQKFAEQAEQIEMLKDCLLEMSEQVYA